jgi:hypothetical protein
MAGTAYSLTAVVHVYDPARLDALLQARWSSLTAALGAGDLQRAVPVFALASREAYEDQLTLLAAAGALPRLAADLGPIRFLTVREGAAEYDLRAVRDGIEYSFHVLFVVDADGVWRLRAF